MKPPIGYDEWNMLDYFWDSKGDLTRWCDWEKFKTEHQGHPVVEAFDRYQSAEETLTLLIRGLKP